MNTFVNPYKNLCKVGKVLKKYNLPKLTQENKEI